MKKRLTFSQLADELPMGRTKFYQLKKDGVFPAGMNAEAGNTVFWLKSEVDIWLAGYDSGLTAEQLSDLSRKIEYVRKQKIAQQKAAFDIEIENLHGGKNV